MNKSRRVFIKQSSVILAGATLLPSFRLEASSTTKEKLGIQLFALNDLMNENAGGTLYALKEMGYVYIEHSNYNNRRFYNYTPADFRKLVTDSGLSLLSGHTVLELQHWDRRKKTFTSDWCRVLEDASAAGQEYIISPWLDRSLWNDEKALKEFLDVLNRCGDLCKRSGLKFGYHNHDFEFSNYLNGTCLYDIILQYTNPNTVYQQLDIGNIDQKLLSVEALFKSYPKRFNLLHIKNITGSNDRHDLYDTAPLDKGELDLKHIISMARNVGGTRNFILDQGHHGGYAVLDNVKMDYAVMNQPNGIFTLA